MPLQVSNNSEVFPKIINFTSFQTQGIQFPSLFGNSHKALKAFRMYCSQFQQQNSDMQLTMCLLGVTCVCKETISSTFLEYGK
jgi:hypothetical protein